MSYVADQKLCILTYLQEYLKRTSPVRGDNKQLLISFVKPYKPISTETISHWIKKCMTTAGVDTTQYKSHRTRAASTSDLASQQFDLKDILNAAGWSKEETFKPFYHFKDNNEFIFGSAIMNTLS